MIASGNSGVIAVFAAIVIADLLIFLGRIPAFTSNGIIGSLTVLKLATPNPFDDPDAKFGFLFLCNRLY